MMTETYSEADAWTACTPGALQQVAARVKGRRRREFLRQAGSVAAGIAVLGAGGYLATRLKTSPSGSPSGQPYGGIACAEVIRLMPRYQAQELSAEMVGRIQLHLARCPECGRMDFTSLTPKVEQNV